VTYRKFVIFFLYYFPSLYVTFTTTTVERLAAPYARRKKMSKIKQQRFHFVYIAFFEEGCLPWGLLQCVGHRNSRPLIFFLPELVYDFSNADPCPKKFLILKLDNMQICNQVAKYFRQNNAHFAFCKHLAQTLIS